MVCGHSRLSKLRRVPGCEDDQDNSRLWSRSIWSLARCRGAARCLMRGRCLLCWPVIFPSRFGLEETGSIFSLHTRETAYKKVEGNGTVLQPSSSPIHHSQTMRFSTTFATLAALCSIAAAVPTAPAPRDCSAEVAQYDRARREARGIGKRSFYPNMLNMTCVLSPETPLEDYVANSPLRSNIVQSQEGVSFIVDIGVINTATCQPLENTMVEFWGPNAVGEYGTFLRGASPTGTNGIAEFTTIFPGFTTGAANHFNILVHTNSSEAGPVSHVGQLFFTDQWTNVVSTYQNYAQNTNSRMMNAQDPSFVAANKNGFNSIIDIEDINDDWPEGIIGYITVGVNPNKAVSISA
ncbi:Intradiol ring-cleavage dioxygenase [Roridomyces roridus]|uniref:Intradiol ring-cleavage dioxygenase n=1 Tax=Roridomyces roridus TaxID=1738132 RepID=A0AAD7BEQ2_9AGAR|nr:Intradiol ring-cleavage dioxygenase [Roridomyces roridus]